MKWLLLIVLLSCAGDYAVPNCDLDAGTNPAACVATWADARSLCAAGGTCTPAGATCKYPGAGDSVTDARGACIATAVLTCAGLTDGGTRWTCAQ